MSKIMTEEEATRYFFKNSDMGWQVSSAASLLVLNRQDGPGRIKNVLYLFEELDRVVKQRDALVELVRSLDIKNVLRHLKNFDHDFDTTLGRYRLVED